MEPQHASALFSLAIGNKKPIKLEIKNEVNGKSQTFENLWVLRLAPGENKFISRIVVADRRWFWSNALVCRDYNMRRKVGTKVATASDQPATNPIVPKYTYQKWSLKSEADPPASKWTPEDVLQDVFKEISKIESDYGGSGFTPQISAAVGSSIKGLPVEDMSLHDSGDMALNRVLASFPEAEVALDAKGQVMVYSRVDGTDANVIKTLGPEIVGRGHFEWINQSIMRPGKMRIFFQIESELRVDYKENATSSSTVVEGQDTLHVDNVLPQPDYQLPIGGGPNATAQGTWIGVDYAFNAWGNLPNPFGGGSKKLDHPLIQKAFMPFNDLWARTGLIGSFSPNQAWGPRLAAVHGHYRTSFRINSRIMDRIADWKAYRVATIDRTSGQRAPAMAWGDYSFLNNVRSCYKRKGEALYYIFNRKGYPASGIIDNGASPSPARVTQEDRDQGIIRVEYYDPFGIYTTFFPSQVDPGSIPHGDYTKKGNQSISFDSVGQPGQQLPKLSASMNIAFIFTVVPGSPNNMNRYFMIEVSPDDVKDIVPGGFSTIANCNGPTMNVLIGPGVETARVQWLDSRAEDIKKMLGLNRNETPPNLKGLVINEGERGDTGTQGNSVSLWALAKAEAARTWALYADRYLGDGTGDFAPSLSPSGYVERIAHSVTTRGEVVTKVNMKEKADALPIDSLLSSGARSILSKQVMV
jgi:hypothetical protein